MTSPVPELAPSSSLGRDATRLLTTARALSGARELPLVTQIVRTAARDLTGADGVTFVLREGDHVHYVDEDAIAPLWKGARYPAHLCISGRAMTTRETIVIDDVYAVVRVPLALYRATFVRSMAMVPVGDGEPVAAIGAYWARPCEATARAVDLLQTLAGLASVALRNVALDAELRAAARTRDEFLELASHELRTPLTVLKLEVDRVGRALQLGVPADADRAFTRARRAVDRTTRLLETLLDVTRLVEGRIQLAREDVDLAALARAVVGRLPSAPAGSRGAVTLEAEGEVRGRWDRVRLEQILENLVGNALKFGAGKPVRVALSATERAATIVVQDRGMGISEEDRARIFGKFERAVSAREFGGFGLGLWLVRQNVEAHGGTIALESRKDEGSTFTVRLPR